MPRAYFRTLPDLYERRAFGSDRHPPNTPIQVAAFVGVLCFAEQQSPRGRFKSPQLLRALLAGPKGLGRMMAAQVPFLIEQGDLIVQPDGSLYVEGWDELQEGNWQVSERMARYRARKDAVTVGVTVPVTVDASRVDGVRAEGQISERRKGGNGVRPPSPRQRAWTWLTDHGAAAPSGWVIKTLDELIRVYGPDTLLDLWAGAPSDVRTSKQFVQYAERSLSPAIHGLKPSGHTRTAQEGRDAFDR